MSESLIKRYESKFYFIVFNQEDEIQHLLTNEEILLTGILNMGSNCIENKRKDGYLVECGLLVRNIHETIFNYSPKILSEYIICKVCTQNFLIKRLKDD